MYNLNSQADRDITKNHKIIQRHGGNMNDIRESSKESQARLSSDNKDDIASRQMQVDSVERYRRQVVRMFYLLAGIGIMGGSIYHLIK